MEESVVEKRDFGATLANAIKDAEKVDEIYLNENNIEELNYSTLTQNPIKEDTEKNKEAVAAEVISSEVGIISENTIIDGDIMSKGHLEIAGTVNGNINVMGDVAVSGNVLGEITCNNILIKTGRIKADINAKGNVTIIATSTIEGNIIGNKIDIEGKVIGEIKASDEVQLTCDASVKGNITAKAIAIGMGAELDGNIKTIK